MRQQVAAARRIQEKRFAGLNVFANAGMSSRLVKKYCKLDNEAESILQQAMVSLALSARAYTKILKVSRTIADLEGTESIRAAHVAEAIQLRTLDRRGIV
jgi:magnesium chelatase family protein